MPVSAKRSNQRQLKNMQQKGGANEEIIVPQAIENSKTVLSGFGLLMNPDIMNKIPTAGDTIKQTIANLIQSGMDNENILTQFAEFKILLTIVRDNKENIDYSIQMKILQRLTTILQDIIKALENIPAQASEQQPQQPSSSAATSRPASAAAAATPAAPAAPAAAAAAAEEEAAAAAAEAAAAAAAEAAAAEAAAEAAAAAAAAAAAGGKRKTKSAKKGGAAQNEMNKIVNMSQLLPNKFKLW